MTILAYVAFFILVFRASVYCAVIFDPPPSNSTVLEGGAAAFTCVPKAEDGSIINALWVIDPVVSSSVTVFPGNSTPLPGADLVILSTNRTQVTITGVQRSLDGAGVQCRGSSQATGQVSAPLVYIIVQRPPNFTLPELSTDVLEGQALNLTLENVDFGNSEGAVSVLFEGRVLSEGNDFNVSRSGSTWSLDFPALNRRDAGVYRVLLNNTVGSSGKNFTVNVVYPPEFTFPTVRSVQLSNGSQFIFNCTASAANPSSIDYSFRKDGDSQLFSVSGTNLTISSVVRADTGNYSCTANNTAGSTTLYYYLVVVAPPQYSLSESQLTTHLEGSTSFTYQFNLDNGGVEPNYTWSRPGTSVLMNGNKYILTADSITVKSVGRNDSVSYTVCATNIAGTQSNSFTLDVQYPPEFTFPTVRSVQLNSGSPFTFNCTASAANPFSVDYSFRKDGSSQPFSGNRPVLTVSSVRTNTGNYSCTANNTAGSTTLYYNLLVVAPPTSPLNLMVSGEMAFSAIVTWTPPTDDGGISHPSWTPPSPSSSPIIQYTVTYSNSSGSWSIDNLNTPLVTLSNLQHSTDYTVTVAASNAHGQSTGVQGTFRTSDSKPILQAVDLAPLSLNNFTANVTFLTVGGQNVTSFSIRVNGTIVEGFTSESVAGGGKGVMVPQLIEGQSFTKGTSYTVEITAANSVGTSEPITGLMFVPNAPNITGTFTEVPADSFPSTKCCAGVQLMLADRVVLSDLNVVLTPTVPSVSLGLQDFTLYIGGVQAGTDYTAVITVSNIFGSSPEKQLQLKPLLGFPSNPNPPTVTVNNGQVTVELSTAYPGTVLNRNGSMFRFEIEFIEDGQRSSRQSKNVTHSVTLPAQSQDLNTTVRASAYVDNLNPGSYSVSVTAVNEHGRSSAVMSESTFTVTAPVTSAPTGDVTIIIIIAIVVVVVLVLIVLIIAIICVICCIRVKKNKKEKYHVGSEDTELTTNRNAVEKNSLDGGRDSFMETGMYDVVGKETKKPPKPQSTPASTTNGQPQPGGDVYAEVNKPKKTNKAAATPTTPPTGDVYAAVDMSKKTKKPKPEAPADKVDPEATLYAEVVQEKKEPAVPPKTEAEYQNPEVDKPIEENELQYAALDFSKAPSSFKKPAPPKPDENVIYSEVTIAKKH